MSTFHVTRRWGATEDAPSVNRLREVLWELSDADDEHPSVSLTHETEWCLEAFESGLLVWEKLEGDTPRHMSSVSPERVLALWVALSAGDLARIEQEPWLPGYG